MQRTPDQEAIIQNRGGSLLVSAAAGSGKTRVLVERLLERVTKEHRRIDEFLIITFTRAAAEELRARISRELSRLRSETPSDPHLRRQTALIYKTQISTIHAFCTVLLRAWGHLLDLPADFSLCEDEETELLKRQALDEVLETRYETIAPEFEKLLDILAAGRDDSRLIEIVLDIHNRMQSHPNPDAWMREQETMMDLTTVTDVSETIWGKLLLADTERTAAHLAAQMAHAVDLIRGDDQLSAAYLESFEETEAALETLQAESQTTWDRAAAVAEIPFARLKAVRNCEDLNTQTKVKAIRERCKKMSEAITLRFESKSEELCADLKMLYPAMCGLFSLVRDFSTHYQDLKRRRGRLDFSDLEHFAVKLLTNDDGSPTPLAKEWGSQFLEIMVDEYQDTNQVQNIIFDAISDEGRNLFMVGDVKQSIYRFRLADPTIFLKKYKNFKPHEQAKVGEPRKILLSQNFRSRPEVLETVNDLFRNIMSEELGEMNYTAEETLYPAGSFPEGNGYATELHVLNFKDTPDLISKKVDRNFLEARFVAERIHTLLEESFQISDGRGGTRAILPSDIAILLRSPGSVRHHYLIALREQNIPLSAEFSSNFWTTTEISVTLSFLQIIDNPYQDIPLLSVLRSPLYSFTADHLAMIRTQSDESFYQALKCCSDTDEDCSAFLKQLDALRFGAGECSSHQLIWNLYEQTGMIEVFESLGGADREGNLLTLYELARRFESNGHRGLFGFLTHLAKIKEGGLNITLPENAQLKPGVQLLSIHRSKGLEYPVVFLCGLGKRFNLSDMQKPVLFHPKLGLGPKGLDEAFMIEFTTLARQAVALQLKREMLAEEMRLLYVAMTRAQEKLILTHTLSFGASDLKKLSDGISVPADPQVLLSATGSGAWILLTAMARPEGDLLRQIAEAEDLTPQAPSRYPWEIHYWDQNAFERPKEVSPTPKEEPKESSIERIKASLSYRYPYEQSASIPSKLTATQLKQSQQEPETILFKRPRFASEALGLTAAQKGVALHTVLQNISLTRVESEVEIAAELLRMTKQKYITQQQADAVSPALLFQFFTSPLGQKIKTVTSLHREFQFSVLSPAERYFNLPPGESVLLQGVIDCWFETEDGICLVDFKTDRVFGEKIGERAESYREQLNVYCYALEEIMHQPVKHKILWFLIPNCGVSLNEA